MEAQDEQAWHDQELEKAIRKSLEYMSFSRLSAFNSCGQKFKLNYIDHVDKDASGFFIGGIAIHDTIEESEKAENQWFLDVANYNQGGPGERFFQERLTYLLGKMSKGRPIYWSNGENEQWWRVQGPRMLRNYQDTRAWDIERGFTMTEDAVEMTLWAKLPTGTDMQVRLDAFLVVTDDGERRIRDYKSGKVGGTTPVQMATYAFAANQQLGTQITEGEFVFVRASDRADRVSVLDVSEMISLVPKMYADAEMQIKAGQFPIRPSKGCEMCGVRRHCMYGKLLQVEETGERT